MDAPPASVDGPVRPGNPMLMPAVLGISVALHGVVLIAATLLPAPSFGMHATPVELIVEVVEPPAPPPPVEEIEEVEEPAPALMPEVPPPRRQRRRVEAEPAPPAPVLTAPESASGPGDWAVHPGEEGGSLDGVPGGTGTGGAGMAEAVSEAAPEPRRTGPSRAELRARVMGYIRGLSGSLAGRVDYPLAARRGHVEGVVILRLRLADDGRVLAVRMSRSSGHGMLDEAALASVRGVDTLPPPPTGVPWDEQRELPVPIRFRLQ